MKVTTKIFTKKGVIKKKKFISTIPNSQRLKEPIISKQSIGNLDDNGPSNGKLDNDDPSNRYIDDDDRPLNGNIDDDGPLNGSQNFFHFPYRWIWINPIMGVKYNANSIHSTSQIHIIQDFNLISYEKSEIQYENNFCCVLLYVLIFEDQVKRLISVCSHPRCQSSGDINRLLYSILTFPIGIIQNQDHLKIT